MDQDRTPFGLRMPEAPKRKVREQAVENGRSQSREIVYRLEQAYRTEATTQNE